MPAAYRAIELGRPLAPSVLPKTALVSQGEGNDSPLNAVEYQQLHLPVGMLRHSLEIKHDRTGNVVRVTYEEYSNLFWVLFLTGGTVRRERYLDESKGGQEVETIHHGPSGIVAPLPNFPVFMMGLHQCFGGEAETARKGSAHPERPPPPVKTEAPSTAPVAP